MSRVKVKICGLTRVTDVRTAVDAGADILGFVFARSPRQLELHAAERLLAVVPEGVTRVGLFMDQDEALVQAHIKVIELDLLQFHGRENNQFCASFGLPYIKAIAMGKGAPAENATMLYPQAQGLLYDSHAPGGPGGSGDTFDWSLLPKTGHQLWLAGGLTVNNVAMAVRRCKPWAVDVSSGVEDRPGIKNHELVRAFVRAAKSVDLEEKREEVE